MAVHVAQPPTTPPPELNVEEVLKGFNHRGTLNRQEVEYSLDALYGVMQNAYRWLECVNNLNAPPPQNLSLADTLKLFKPDPPYFSQTHIGDDFEITPLMIADFLQAYKEDPSVFCGYTASQLTNICYAEQLATKLVDENTEPPRWRNTDLTNETPINKGNFCEFLNEHKREPLRWLRRVLSPQQPHRIFPSDSQHDRLRFEVWVNKCNKTGIPQSFTPTIRPQDTRTPLCITTRRDDHNQLDTTRYQRKLEQQQQHAATLEASKNLLDSINKRLVELPSEWQIVYNVHEDPQRRPDEILVKVNTENWGYTNFARIYRDTTNGKINLERLIYLNDNNGREFENLFNTLTKNYNLTETGWGWEITEKSIPAPPPYPPAP